MQLPAHPDGGVQIGISDILAWRDCPARFQFGMQRHGDLGESPESWSPANAYGSMIHHCIHLVNEGLDEEEAIQSAFEAWPQWVEPDTLDRLRDDLEIYLGRDPIGVTTILSEEDWSIPLFVHPTAGQVWFRFRLDRLYQVVEQPHRFIHVDYKSSRWPKGEDEVNKDLQLWSYNLGISVRLADLYPEHDAIELLQLYDQLKYGQVPTRKNDAQRVQIRDWLIKAVTAMIADEKMAPTWNQWCPWCSIAMDCPVVQYQLTDWARARIAALMPRKPKKKKDGTDSKVLEPPELDPERFAEYGRLLPDVKRARQVLELFEEQVKNVIRDLPIDKQAALVTSEAPKGYVVDHRNRKEFTVDGLRLAHEAMGDEFYYAATMSEASLKRLYGDDAKERLEEILRHRVDGAGFDVVVPAK